MIGNWDNSNCVVAVLPLCLKLGSNPLSIQADSGNGPSFPVYHGPSSTTNYKFVLFDGCKYDDGIIDHTANLVNPANGVRTLACVLSTVALNLSLTPTNGYTVHCWIKLVNSTGRNQFFGFHTKTPSGQPQFYGLYFPPALYGNSTLLPATQTPSAYRSLVIPNPFDGNFHLITCVKDGGTFRGFFDGIEYTTSLLDSGLPFNSTVSCPHISFGTRDSKYDMYPFKGYSQGFIVYDSYIGADRILADFNLGPSLGGLIGFDQGDGNLNLLRRRKPVTSTNDLSYYYTLAWGREL